MTDLLALTNATLPARTDEMDNLSSMIDSLDGFIAKADPIDCHSANEAWRIKTALEIKRQYLNAFSLLKEKKHYEAWCLLERCEINLQFLLNNSDASFQSHARLAFFSRHIENWQSLFPYKVFFSPGYLVDHYTCSICSFKIRPSGSCGHKKGKVYGGQLCMHIANKIEVLEISLVENPVQKYSVALVDYDYSVVDYVAERLSDPYDGWQPIKTRKLHDRSKFSSLPKESKCPCREGDRDFIDCCWYKDAIEIPHIEIAFSKAPPTALPPELFPY